jgi:hypothetical protein
MKKKEGLIKNYSVLLSLIAVLSIIGLVTTLQTIGITIDSSLSPLVPQVWAQVPTGMPTPDGQQIIQQGVGTSSPDPLPGHEAHQSITILRLRNDNAVYSGTLTFTTTAPVEVQVLHRNMTTTGGGGAATTTATPGIPEEFGTLSMLPLPGGNGIVTISNIIPEFPEDTTTFAGSVPFTGNAIALHNIEGEPFAATYTVTADVVGTATRADDIGTAPPPTAAAEEEEEVEEEEAEEEEG